MSVEDAVRVLTGEQTYSEMFQTLFAFLYKLEMKVMGFDRNMESIKQGVMRIEKHLSAVTPPSAWSPPSDHSMGSDWGTYPISDGSNFSYDLQREYEKLRKERAKLESQLQVLKGKRR